jgi:hypothetical protein
MGFGFAERPIGEAEEPPTLKEHIARAQAVHESPDPAGCLAGTHLDAIGPGLLPDRGSPFVGIVNVIARSDHLSGEQQLAVVITPAHALDEALDPPVDLDRILHSLEPTLGRTYERISTSQRTPLAFSIPPSAVSSKARKDSAKAT